MSPGLDLAAGVVSGIASALVGQPGPPVLIYLLLAGAAAKTVRATLIAFFALSQTRRAPPMPIVLFGRDYQVRRGGTLVHDPTHPRSRTSTFGW
jgi:hypothetical protein